MVMFNWRRRMEAPTMVSVMPRRKAQRSSWSVNRCRHSATAIAEYACCRLNNDLQMTM